MMPRCHIDMRGAFFIWRFSPPIRKEGFCWVDPKMIHDLNKKAVSPLSIFMPVWNLISFQEGSPTISMWCLKALLHTQFHTELCELYRREVCLALSRNWLCIICGFETLNHEILTRCLFEWDPELWSYEELLKNFLQAFRKTSHWKL